MGCLATGCSWTNRIPPDELTIMCLNRERTRDRGGGLSTDAERTKTGKGEQKETEAGIKTRESTERKKVGSDFLMPGRLTDCPSSFLVQTQQIQCIYNVTP